MAKVYLHFGQGAGRLHQAVRSLPVARKAAGTSADVLVTGCFYLQKSEMKPGFISLSGFVRQVPGRT
ncbi:MAG: hypothetical protein ACOY3X_08165 [Pseudomonadota bacterium]